MTFSFGPGPLTPAVRAIIYANVAIFLLTLLAPEPLISTFGLTPRAVLHGAIWQPVTYLFLHSPSGISHILFNMLAVWMFGVDLERRWGTREFTRYYFITGVGAGLLTILISLLPLESARQSFAIPTIGASGAVYGLLIAWGLIFPTRTILFMMIFPLQARVYVLLMGALAFLAAMSATNNNVANVAHLGGLLIGWLYLKGPRQMRLEFQYRMSQWRMNRLRRKFDVHKGGKSDWKVH